MKSAVSAIIFASIISITIGETTVPTPYPTYPPYPTYAPIAPTATCTGSTPGWVDVDGYGCGWYEMNDYPDCPYWGGFGGYDWNTGEMIIGEPGSVPNDNCCYCFGDPPVPTDRRRLNQLTIYTITCAISAISVLSLQFAILRSPKLRSNTFNLYLVFCLAPDTFYFPLQLLYNVLLLVEESQYLATNEYWTNSYVISFFAWWGDWYWLCASLWMSLSVFVQIYKLLTANKQAKRYQPPTRKRVIRDSTIIHIFSGVVATVKPFYFWMIGKSWSVRASNILWWIGLIPVVFIPTLLITGMCFGVWWSKLLPRKNARYRSLTVFFARLLASAYLMVIGWAITLELEYFPRETAEKTRTCLYLIFYLFGLFQVCLALTKKDIRVAFIEMWCCGNHDNFVTRSAFFGRLTRTTRESYGHEDDGYDGEPATVDNATSSVINATVLNQDIHPNENDGNEADTIFVESTTQYDSGIIENEGSVVDDINGEQSGAENLSDIDEANNEIAMSKEDKNSVQV